MGKWTVFTIIGKKGVSKGDLMRVSRLTRKPMEKWLREIFPPAGPKETITEKTYYDAVKRITFEQGNDVVDRVVFIRGVDAPSMDEACSAIRHIAWALNPEENEFLTEAHEAFDEITDPEEVGVTAEPMQYVKGSQRQKGYHRRKPYHYRAPTDDMREARRILTKTAFLHGRDKFGKAKIVDKKGREKEVPASAVPVIENMKGLRIAKPKPVVVSVPQLSPVDRLKRMAEILERAGT